ncbi:hypothetical protein CathTA2_0875 [Caldalkalibacillus thermarum TA2.A1]|uniref:Uncharacterized protein n=1 Tax=Caldalkalibacillus thermarum (strain TA2.A1) TaxID=986075 RepID=F5L512_CALTT|nr:hypothetical protein CathTA2_0875 [Caldalkalibacillus thermarum TA2.A1]
MEELKAKGKTIILEVEPVDEDDSDTVKRERFYLSNGFKKAEQIRYYRDVGETSHTRQVSGIKFFRMIRMFEKSIKG